MSSTEAQHFMGKNGYYWWHGVVEDRTNDPLRLGRLRVRILGVHTKDRENIPVDHLMWAMPTLDVLSSGPANIGWAPIGVTEGAHVFGFFRDASACQDPVVTDIIPGTSGSPRGASEGFSDPRTDTSGAPKKLVSISYINGGVTGRCVIEQASQHF